MAYSDWNQNGRHDSFDRYVDYRNTHPTPDSNKSYNNNHNTSSHCDGLTNVDKEELERIKLRLKKQDEEFFQQRQETPKVLTPTTIVAAIISIIFGVILTVVWLNAVN